MIVLDTNIISYDFLNVWPIELYRRHLDGRVLAISFMTLAETLEGAYRLGLHMSKARRILTSLKRYEVLPCNDDVCDIWGRIRAERRRQPIAVDDAWIAATAIAYGLPLVTHNAKDFGGIGQLTIITEYR